MMWFDSFFTAMLGALAIVPLSILAVLAVGLLLLCQFVTTKARNREHWSSYSYSREHTRRHNNG